MRPHVVVHMMTSVDGRIRASRWTPFPGRGAYEEVHALLEADAWMCGRVTMSGCAKGSAYPETTERLPRTDHVARREAPFAIALDPSGKLCWNRGGIDDDHIVVVLTEAVPDRHLAGVRRDGVSYVFGGRDAIDLPRVLATLRRDLGIRRLVVEGGGRINGAFLAAGLVDEISLLVAPTVDGRLGSPSLFDVEDETDGPLVAGLALTLQSARPLADGVLWLRYGATRH